MPAIRERDIEKGRRDFLACKTALEHQAQKASESSASSSPSSGSLTGVTLPSDSSDPDYVPRPVIAMAVRYTLAVLEKVAPGPSTELRVAPYAAIKIFPGPDSDPHNLTPPDVVEIDPNTWLRLACGITTWEQEKAAGHVAPIGPRDEKIGRLVPIRA
jgi:hypothetical protein